MKEEEKEQLAEMLTSKDKEIKQLAFSILDSEFNLETSYELKHNYDIKFDPNNPSAYRGKVVRTPHRLGPDHQIKMFLEKAVKGDSILTKEEFLDYINICPIRKSNEETN